MAPLTALGSRDRIQQHCGTEPQTQNTAPDPDRYRVTDPDSGRCRDPDPDHCRATRLKTRRTQPSSDVRVAAHSSYLS